MPGVPLTAVETWQIAVSLGLLPTSGWVSVSVYDEEGLHELGKEVVSLIDQLEQQKKYNLADVHGQRQNGS